MERNLFEELDGESKRELKIATLFGDALIAVFVELLI